MRALFLSIVLGIAALGLTAATPAQAKAQPWYRGGWYSRYYGGGPYYGRGFYWRGSRYWSPGYGSYGYYRPRYSYYYPSYSYYAPSAYYPSYGYSTFSYSPGYYYGY